MKSITNLETASVAVESLSMPLEMFSREDVMVSVFSIFGDQRSPSEVIRSVGELLAPKKPARMQYEPIYRSLSKFVPEEHRMKVTPRRVRAIFNDEARRVEWYEMKALLEIEALEEARRARRQLAATSHRLAALITADTETLDSEERRELGRLAGALDRAGIRPISV